LSVYLQPFPAPLKSFLAHTGALQVRLLLLLLLSMAKEQIQFKLCDVCAVHLS